MYGLPAEDIVGRRTIDLRMWADDAQRDKMLELLRKGSDIDALNVRFRKADGELRDALAAFKRTRIAGEDCIVSLVQDVTERERYLRAVQANREELRALNVRLQQVREEERMKLARDLHDALGQSLTGLKMDLAYIRKLLGGDEGPQEAADSIRRMMGVLDGTISSVRNIAMELRPGMVDDLGLAESIRWYANEFSKRSRLPVSVRIRNAPELLSPEHALSVFRIAQEALTNIARHAAATQVRIGLRVNNGKLILVVTDDGVGLEASATTGKNALGIVGMRERAAALGGTLTVRSRPGRGCTVSAEIPFPAPGTSAGAGDERTGQEHQPHGKDQA
jgi:signal transduction histidine kinase